MEGTRREADLAGIGGCRVQRGPSTDRERVLGKTKSTASDDEREEKALKDRERERAWAAATTLREKYVNFVVPRTFTEKDMDLAYQTTAAAAWREGLCVIAGPKDGAWHPAQNVAPRALARSPH